MPFSLADIDRKLREATARARRPKSGPPPRLSQLDGLRGLAAASVVLHHAVLSVPGGASVDGVVGTLGSVVLLGRPAVVLFFVLSGFVLTLHLTARPESLVAFASRRLARLLPPYWAAMIGAYFLFCLTSGGHIQDLSPWFTEQWGSPIPPRDLLLHLAMLAGPRQFPLDHVAWSLVHELRLSLLLPLLIVVSNRVGSQTTLVITAVISTGATTVLTLYPQQFPTGVYGFRFDAPGLGPSFVLTSRFALDFALGAALAFNKGWIGAALARVALLKPIALAIALAFLSQLNEAVMAVGAALTIALAVSWPQFAETLKAVPAAWLGRVSYSLYLVHLPIMLACGSARSGSAPASLAIGVLLSFPCAELFYRLVEEPSIQFSRAVGRAVATSTASLPASFRAFQSELVEHWLNSLLILCGHLPALIKKRRSTWALGLRYGAVMIAGIALGASGCQLSLGSGEPRREPIIGVELLAGGPSHDKLKSSLNRFSDDAVERPPDFKKALLPLSSAVSFTSKPYGLLIRGTATGRQDDGPSLVGRADSEGGSLATQVPFIQELDKNTRRRISADKISSTKKRAHEQNVKD